MLLLYQNFVSLLLFFLLCIWKQSCVETQAQLCEHLESWVMLSFPLDPACSPGQLWCCWCLLVMDCRCGGLLGFILDLQW